MNKLQNVIAKNNLKIHPAQRFSECAPYPTSPPAPASWGHLEQAGPTPDPLK